MNVLTSPIIQFDLPQHLACPLPTEERHLKRDDVRLLVSTNSGKTSHTTFNQLPLYLQKGDVLVVNTSATVRSALPIALPGGVQGRLHLSTRLSNKKWLVEIRVITGNKTIRWHKGEQGMTFQLQDSATVLLKEKFYNNEQWLDLWIAEFHINQPMPAYLYANAQPIQYDKLDRQYPLAYYQTFFSFYPGSAEMPSAARGFTGKLVEQLLEKGIVLAPVVLHTGISSLEEHETPYPEYMEIDPVTAATINVAKSEGRRIIAVGTTAIRAVESAVNAEELLRPYRGNTDLFITESYKMKIVDGLLTGFHEPKASHLNMLQSIGGYHHIDMAYKEAIQAGYYWHQFGDLHLILP